MKVNLRIFSLIAILLITSTALVFANDSKVSVIINNQPVTYSNETGYPFLDSNGRTQVPFRQTMTAFGCTVDWNKEAQTAIAMKDGIKVEVPIGKAYILKDGANVPNDTSAVIINGKTYLPIAIVLRSFGAEVSWDNNSKSVLVSNTQNLQINIESDNDVIPEKKFIVYLLPSDYKFQYENNQGNLLSYSNCKSIIEDGIIVYKGTGYVKRSLLDYIPESSDTKCDLTKLVKYNGKEYVNYNDIFSALRNDYQYEIGLLDENSIIIIKTK